jgi:hypothetical protein
MARIPGTVPLYPYPHTAANEPVTLHEGPVAIAGCAAGTGQLVLRWLPSANLCLEADLDSMDIPRGDDGLTVAVAGTTAEVLFHSVSLGNGTSGLRLALHWYQKSNTRAGGMEGAIILSLTALDLLGGLVVVEREGAMNDRMYDKLSAKDKLSALLGVLKVPSAIPVKLTDLAAFAAANSWTIASEALAEIRHGYVHSNKKLRQVVLSAPNLAVFQAWQLSLWYQEPALLYLLGHKGEYRNRLTPESLGEVEKVPWA